jgi:hypothetical protein
MQFISHSLTLPSVDHFLMLLIVTIGVSFSLYLLLMFVLGAIARHPSPDHPSPPQTSAQDVIRPFNRPLTTLTIRQLKQRARAAQIPYYSRMVKSQLISALQAA